MRTVLSAGLCIAIGSASAHAQDVTAAALGEDRTGLVVGGSIDGGSVTCGTRNGDDCGDNSAKPAAGLSLHAGKMIRPELAILGEIWGMAHTEHALTASEVLVTANARAWLMPRVWVQGGLGAARSEISYKTMAFMATGASTIAPAFSAGVGVEVLQSRGFGLDIEARGGSAFYESDARVWNFGGGVGVTWF